MNEPPRPGQRSGPERGNGAQPPQGFRLTEQQLRARRTRSIAIALALFAFVVVIFLVTLVRLGSNVAVRPM